MGESYIVYSTNTYHPRDTRSADIAGILFPSWSQSAEWPSPRTEPGPTAGPAAMGEEKHNDDTNQRILDAEA